MQFYFKADGAKVHLYRENGFFDDDLGELRQTLSGKLETNNFFGENFELEDISGFFSKGIRYSKSATTSSTGGLPKALIRALLLLAQKGGVASVFTGPLKSGTSCIFFS